MSDRQTNERPYWYETDFGMIVCQFCRQELLREWAPGIVKWSGQGGVRISTAEEVRASDFRPLGRTPWAGNAPGERYMQCDHCNGQWGPDA